MSVAGLFDAR